MQLCSSYLSFISGQGHAYGGLLQSQDWYTSF